jgi:hypothetical protein
MELREWNGQKLNIRPHWAKEWWVVLLLSIRTQQPYLTPSCRQQFKVDGRPFAQYLKTESYGDAIRQFNDVLAEIGQ